MTQPASLHLPRPRTRIRPTAAGMFWLLVLVSWGVVIWWVRS